MSLFSSPNMNKFKNMFDEFQKSHEPRKGPRIRFSNYEQYMSSIKVKLTKSSKHRFYVDNCHSLFYVFSFAKL